MNGKINQLRAGVVLTYVSLGVGYLVSMVFTPVMIRMLGQNEYGLYTLVLSVAAYLNLLNFGFGASYMRFYARFREHGTEDDIKRLNGLFLLTFIVIAAVALAAGLMVAENVDLLKKTLTPDEVARARVLIRVLSINLAFTLIASVFTSFITAQERFVFQKSVQIVKNLLSP
ncbi:MAG: polysaccharide biosynthesis protein, partial [Clostridiales bacterium]